jgi:hypothetical protein
MRRCRRSGNPTAQLRPRISGPGRPRQSPQGDPLLPGEPIDAHHRRGHRCRAVTDTAAAAAPSERRPPSTAAAAPDGSWTRTCTLPTPTAARTRRRPAGCRYCPRPGPYLAEADSQPLPTSQAVQQAQELVVAHPQLDRQRPRARGEPVLTVPPTTGAALATLGTLGHIGRTRTPSRLQRHSGLHPSQRRGRQQRTQQPDPTAGPGPVGQQPDQAG